jgi:hypothetical protein
MQTPQSLYKCFDLLDIHAESFYSLCLHLLTAVQKAFNQLPVHETHGLILLLNRVLESAEFGEVHISGCLDEGAEVRLEGHEEILVCRGDEAE